MSFFNVSFIFSKLVYVFLLSTIFFSYYIARNIFDSKIALITQLFVAFNPWCGIFSIQAANELLAIFIITVTLYLITKREFKTIDMIIIGSLLGLVFMIRSQTVVFLISFMAYLLVRNRNFLKNIRLTGLIVIFFLVAASPLFFYNFTTHGVLLDNDINKQGKRLYGTNMMVKSPKVLADVKNPIIILKAGVYNDEVKRDILGNINKNAKFL